MGSHKPLSRGEHGADCLPGAGWGSEAALRLAGGEGDQNCYSDPGRHHEHPHCEWGDTHSHSIHYTLTTLMLSLASIYFSVDLLTSWTLRLR